MSQETPEDAYPLRFATASVVVGRHLMDLDTDSARKGRKQRILERRLDELRRGGLETSGGTGNLYEVKAPSGFAREHAATIVVDLAFCSPFAPYQVEVSEDDFAKALHLTGAEMNFSKAYVARVLALKKDAMQAHAHGPFSSPWRLVVAGVVAIAALPLLPALIGGAGGLAGAAASAHGLALLSGGSLAVGGFGMAGGIWVLSGLEVAVVVATGTGARASALVRAAPPEALRLEVAKAQTTAVFRMENGSWTRQDVAERLRGFDDRKHDLEADLRDEEQHSDPDAPRIRVLQEKLKVLEIGRAWIAGKLG